MESMLVSAEGAAAAGVTLVLVVAAALVTGSIVGVWRLLSRELGPATAPGDVDWDAVAAAERGRETIGI